MNAASAQVRREAIIRELCMAKAPVSASRLAEQQNVSRQIIVGDIALLRASGYEISATPRGYVLPQQVPIGLRRTIACQHTAAQMRDELYIMVDNGCTVLDVVVEHPIYGQLTGPLMLSSRYETDQFIEQCSGQDAAPLSSLTGGIHLHNLLCPDENAWMRVRSQLNEAGFLVNEKE